VIVPDAIRELWLQQFPKSRVALETLSSKSTKSVDRESTVAQLRCTRIDGSRAQADEVIE
jgi:hypothetical protein